MFSSKSFKTSACKNQWKYLSKKVIKQMQPIEKKQIKKIKKIQINKKVRGWIKVWSGHREDEGDLFVWK